MRSGLILNATALISHKHYVQSIELRNDGVALIQRHIMENVAANGCAMV
ncbi:hypothetical protein C8R11_11440 [Nitrosomonas aestuarii]|nr:hypothetical protein C8R11_11440 [Nitrosomonas aestuarii]